MSRIMLGVPCFAEPRETLLRALRSFQQPDVDVVAIDNGGTPDVKRAIDEMKGIAVVRNEKNIYVNPAWNQLAERFLASDAQILVVANADIAIAPGWSQSLLMRHTRADRELWFGHFVHRVEDIMRSYGPSDEEAGGEALWSGGSLFALARKEVRIVFPIPRDLLIWYGDNWIFAMLQRAGYRGVILRDMVCWPPALGISTNHIRREADEIIARDRAAWDSHLRAVCGRIGEGIKGGTMDEIEQRFILFRDTPADINEHMQRLCDLARGCESVTEFGIGRSTWAFLHARPHKLRCYDIRGDVDFSLQNRLAGTAGVDLRFERADTLALTIEPTDLLFIDTYHVHRNLKIELDRHAAMTRKFIAMHDTTTFGDRGEDGSTPGLWVAVEQFVSAHPEWRVIERRHNNNGLTVLQRS